MSKGAIVAIVIVGALLASLLGAIGMVGGAGMATAANCTPAGGAGAGAPGSAVTLAQLPAVEGYSPEQVNNAGLIMNAAAAMGLSTQAQVIGVMVAMGESSLVNIDRGDLAGPDSRGLFQQRGNGAWGSYADRMNPTTAATNFFRALTNVQGWEALEPSIAAHRVQRNADPYHYAKYWEPANRIATAFSGTNALTGCVPGNPGAVNAEGWALPSSGPVSSPFGYRIHPIKGTRILHEGVDVAPGCDVPIHAANSGTVTFAGPSGGYGNLILIDHGGGVVTGYGHMWANGVQVSKGQQVTGGQQVGLVGSAGGSTGCHLHFEVRVGGEPTDPVAFMKAVGITIG